MQGCVDVRGARVQRCKSMRTQGVQRHKNVSHSRPQGVQGQMGAGTMVQEMQGHKGCKGVRGVRVHGVQAHNGSKGTMGVRGAGHKDTRASGCKWCQGCKGTRAVWVQHMCGCKGTRMQGMWGHTGCEVARDVRLQRSARVQLV